MSATLAFGSITPHTGELVPVEEGAYSVENSRQAELRVIGQISGVSGEGYTAEGTAFDSRSGLERWLGKLLNTGIFKKIGDSDTQQTLGNLFGVTLDYANGTTVRLVFARMRNRLKLLVPPDIDTHSEDLFISDNAKTQFVRDGIAAYQRFIELQRDHHPQLKRFQLNSEPA